VELYDTYAVVVDCVKIIKQIPLKVLELRFLLLHINFSYIHVLQMFKRMYSKRIYSYFSFERLYVKSLVQYFKNQ